MHGALAFTTFSVLIDGDGAGDEQAEEGAGLLLGSDLGRALLFAVGLGIFGFAVYQVFIGFTRRFHRILRDDMHDAFEHVVERSGTVGHIARGVAPAVIGVGFAAFGVFTFGRSRSGLI